MDAKQIGIEGHSRYGKATLVTMAYDPRFAIAYVSSSGAGGADLWRRHWGEEIGNVAGTGEYHWMDGNFLKYAGPLTPNDFSVDQHELIALCAPRPVFISAGSLQAGDGWVDAKGMFLAAAAAGPVYKLLGKKDMGTNDFPPMETPLIAGDIAFRQHSGGHTPAPNWPTFITFATRYLRSVPMEQPASAPVRALSDGGEVALTFDDLPVHAYQGDCSQHFHQRRMFRIQSKVPILQGHAAIHPARTRTRGDAGRVARRADLARRAAHCDGVAPGRRGGRSHHRERERRHSSML